MSKVAITELYDALDIVDATAQVRSSALLLSLSWALACLMRMVRHYPNMTNKRISLFYLFQGNMWK